MGDLLHHIPFIPVLALPASIEQLSFVTVIGGSPGHLCVLLAWFRGKITVHPSEHGF